MTKTLNDMIEEHCRKGLSPAHFQENERICQSFRCLQGCQKIQRDWKLLTEGQKHTEETRTNQKSD